MPNNKDSSAFAVQPGIKNHVNNRQPFANRNRRRRPGDDQSPNPMVESDRVDYDSVPVKPKRKGSHLNKVAEEAQFKHQQYRQSRNKSKTKSDFDVEVGFGKGNSRGRMGASMLRRKGNTSQRTIFFDETGSEPVTLERRHTHMFPDPYRNPSTVDPKVFVKSLEFNLFKFIPADTFDTVIEFERESLFKSMLQDIRRTFTSPQYQNLTTQSLFNYFNAVSRAVIEYYEIDSLMANDAYKYSDVNRGIRLLKDSAATETRLLETQYKLRRAIQGSYLPTKVFELIRWASQWYTFNEEGDSRATAFKFSLGLGLKNICTAGSAEIDRRPAFTHPEYFIRVNNLCTQLFEQQEAPGIQAAIAKTFPEWAINDLPLSCNRPIYDQRATDLWLNQPALLKTNTTEYVEPVNEMSLEMATMDESGLDQVVPSCVSVRAITQMRTDSQLDAILTPDYHLAQWNPTVNPPRWDIGYSIISTFGPQAQDPMASCCSLQMNNLNLPIFTWLDEQTSQALPDTYKLAYNNGFRRYTQFNSEVLRLKPMTESQKEIETSEFVTRLMTG
uniref:Uncharacterized protein n=1 Tax=viral metagenome TaxID=1070528 RepID=A0A2V0R905_9ZZZZ